MTSSSSQASQVLPRHSPWSDLPVNILSKIASCLQTTLDVAHFALVCPAWKVASYSNELHHSKQFPWLLVPEKPLPSLNYYSWFHTDPRTGCRRFFMPTITEQLSCHLPPACGRRCVGSGFGWLLMLSIDEQITMVSPLTGAQVSLPQQSTLKFASQWQDKEKHRSYISKIALGKDDSGFIVAVAVAGDCRNLAIARPRDHTWTAIKCKWSRVTDVVIHQGKIYAVNNKGRLVACNLAGQVERIIDPPKVRLNPLRNWYVVFSSSGSLLLVAREYTREREPITIHFKVFEFLKDEDQWMQIEDLGDRALFVGFNTSTSIEAPNLRQCEANCVYFTDDCIDVYRHNIKHGGGYDTGKYNLENKSIVERYYAGACPYSPPLWYVPRLPSPSMELQYGCN